MNSKLQTVDRFACLLFLVVATAVSVLTAVNVAWTELQIGLPRSTFEMFMLVCFSACVGGFCMSVSVCVLALVRWSIRYVFDLQ